MSNGIERIVPDTKEWDAYYANHIYRYEFAAKKINNPKRVLDAACGVGYGSKFLCEKLNAPVLGVDIDENSLSIARDRFKEVNVQFQKEDCEKLENVDGVFTHVISFETFEHLKYPEKFLEGAYILLELGGQLILSTPNASVTSPNRVVNWKFHEKEYLASEIIDMMQSAGFKHIQLYGQAYSELGLLKKAFRKELNRIHHNPFIRLGKLIQKKLRDIEDNYAVLPEEVEDFETQAFETPEECENLGEKGPFVLLVTAEKI